MKSIKNKEDKIDNLARMVQTGFQEVGEKFNDLVKDMKLGFNEIHRRFDRLESVLMSERK